jgi:hypothetical protein
MGSGRRKRRQPPRDQEVSERAATAQAEQAACQADLDRVTCELQVERLRREDREDAEEKKRRQKEREKEKQWQRKEARREARRTRWRAFWERRRKRREELGGVTGTLTVLLALGVPTTLALLIYAFAASAGEGEAALDRWEVLAVGLLAAAAAFAVGALLGFLFGIPRSVAAPAPDPSEQGTERKDGEEEPAVGQHFAANTNLEQISDWLTKILVGVGLVQIHQISGAIDDLANGLAPALGPQGYGIAVALLVAYPIIGFVSAYLFTRLRLQGAFELATVIKRAVKERADTETSAIALVQQQLTPGPDKPTLDKVVQALEKATPGIRQQAFYLARRQRSEEWGESVDEEEKRELISCTIPVFEALLVSAPEIPAARLHAEMGHTYLRMESPDFVAAKSAFDEAIKLRPPGMATRTPQYELNRAYCTVKIDENYKSGQPSPHVVVASVNEDLGAVINLLKLEEVSNEKRGVLTTWLQTNSTSEDELAPQLAVLRERVEEVNKDG